MQEWKFYEEALSPGDLLVGIALHGSLSFAIRATIGSVSTHNALFIRHRDSGHMCIGDTTPPKSAIVPLSHYEQMINSGGYLVRVWRVIDATPEEREAVSLYWQDHCCGIRYAELTMMRLWVMRFVNDMPYRIRPIFRKEGTWCSRNTGLPWTAIVGPERSPLRKPVWQGGGLKKNETPRTFENRLALGVLEDVTRDVLVCG